MNGVNPNIVTISRPKLLSVLLTIFFFIFVYRAVNGVITILSLIKTVQQNHLLIHLFEQSPYLCLLPIFSVCLAIYILYLIFKTSKYSHSDFLLIIISSIIIPIVYGVFIYFLSTTPYPAGFSLITAILNEVLVISILIIFYSLLIPKEYTQTSTEMTLSQVTSLTLLASLILFPTSAFTYYLIDASLNPDTNRTVIEKIVSHKLYYPLTLPQHLKVGSKFYVTDSKESLLTEPIVKISFTANKTSVILTQTKVPTSFDLMTYAYLQVTGGSLPEKVIVSSARNQEAYLLIKQPTVGSTLSIRSLYYVSTDGILVDLTSPNTSITPDDLISIAQSLR